MMAQGGAGPSRLAPPIAGRRQAEGASDRVAGDDALRLGRRCAAEPGAIADGIDMVDAGHTRKARSAWFRLHPMGLSGPGTTAATQHPACGVVLVSTY